MAPVAGLLIQNDISCVHKQPNIARMCAHCAAFCFRIRALVRLRGHVARLMVVARVSCGFEVGKLEGARSGCRRYPRSQCRRQQLTWDL